MGNISRVDVQDYYTLMWWAMKGFWAIQHGEDPQQTAAKYIDGITALISELERKTNQPKWKKLWRK